MSSLGVTFSHRLYYQLKPYLPWQLRMTLRRATAALKRKRCRAVWPICEAAGRKPDGWTGWPNGKQFAIVLTHDVESERGLQRCRQLAELEMELGFRSAFNFIPEGDYRVPDTLRDWLCRNQFEIGVHDLEHDGRLFAARRGFRRKARRINQYLADWQAKGFRSGFMLRNLEWLHDLNIVYDSSTFDTDPFELQSDGTGTIFPFWVPRPAGSGSEGSESGYVELPYTLPQDSTLFLVLRETSADIWIRKVDWIASHGGMALVNVHPDYMQFPGETKSSRTSPVENYIRLLKHIKSRHAEDFWPALPREVASFVLSSAISGPKTK